MISAAHTWLTWLIIGLFDDFWLIQLDDDHDLTFYALLKSLVYNRTRLKISLIGRGLVSTVVCKD